MNCPKCESEMEHAIGRKGTIAEGIEEWFCGNCGCDKDYNNHEEKVK
jgi:transposase-like protein